jgi:hypothetical protein
MWHWLTENWFAVLFFIAFIAMHLFGHGMHGDGCGGHGGHGEGNIRDTIKALRRKRVRRRRKGCYGSKAVYFRYQNEKGGNKMKKLLIVLAVLFIFSVPAYAHMDMMGEQKGEMKQGMMDEGMMPMMKQMMRQGMMMQDMMQMMMDMMKMQKRMMMDVSSSEKKEMMMDMDKMVDRMEKMMSDMRGIMMKEAPAREEAPEGHQHKH